LGGEGDLLARRGRLVVDDVEDAVGAARKRGVDRLGDVEESGRLGQRGDEYGGNDGDGDVGVTIGSGCRVAGINPPFAANSTKRFAIFLGDNNLALAFA